MNENRHSIKKRAWTRVPHYKILLIFSLRTLHLGSIILCLPLHLLRFCLSILLFEWIFYTNLVCSMYRWHRSVCVCAFILLLHWIKYIAHGMMAFFFVLFNVYICGWDFGSRGRNCNPAWWVNRKEPVHGKIIFIVFISHSIYKGIRYSVQCTHIQRREGKKRKTETVQAYNKRTRTERGRIRRFQRIKSHTHTHT